MRSPVFQSLAAGRRTWLVLGALAAGVLLSMTAPAAAAPTQSKNGASCAFTKIEAIKANGGPLGQSIWGRLCQAKDGKETYAGGVKITVRQGDEIVGTTKTTKGGVFVIKIPGNDTYQVALDPDTLPKGFALTNAKRATLPQVKVNLGDQQAIFRLGADTRGERTFSDYATTMAKGLRLGLILAVAAVGLSLVYGVTGLTNFAHAELVTFGALVAYGLDSVGIPFWLTLIPAVLIGGGAGWLNDLAIWRPLRKRHMALLSMMVVSIGLSTAVRNIFQVQFDRRGVGPRVPTWPRPPASTSASCSPDSTWPSTIPSPSRWSTSST